MTLRSRRKIFGISGTAGLFLLSVLVNGQTGQAGQTPRPQMSEDVFKNVQILKGIPVDEFMDTMGMFAAALSLNCVDCHTSESVGSWDKFADETPLKRTARRMMLMVNNINKDNFGGVAGADLLHVPSRRPASQGRAESRRAVRRARRGCE